MKRKPNEKFEKYQERRLEENQVLKTYLKGRMWWPSSEAGTLCYKIGDRTKKNEIEARKGIGGV